MSETNADPKLMEKILSIVGHLKVESDYLDTVIASSLEMQTILRERRNPTGSNEPQQNESEQTQSATAIGLQVEHNQRLHERMVKLRTGIERDFLPVAEGRMQLVRALKTIDPGVDKTLTLSELAMKVEEPLRSELKTMRNEIRGKLNQVHSISMGNQAVLLYTLDFYNRLLSGLSTDDQQSSYYNANGRSQNHVAGSLVQTKC